MSGYDEDAKVDLTHFPEAQVAIKEVAEYLDTLKYTLDKRRDDVIANWVGDGRNAFENAYRIMVQKLQDQTDLTWEIFSELCSDYESFIKADVDIAKGLTGESEVGHHGSHGGEKKSAGRGGKHSSHGGGGGGGRRVP